MSGLLKKFYNKKFKSFVPADSLVHNFNAQWYTIPSLKTNYRPILLLSSFSKVVEKNIKKLLPSFFANHKVCRENENSFNKTSIAKSLTHCLITHTICIMVV